MHIAPQKPLISARSVVQVHPGPPFKSPVNMRLFSLFPFRGISPEKPICQPFVNFRIGRIALSQGVSRQRNSHSPAARPRSREITRFEEQKPAEGCKQKRSL